MNDERLKQFATEMVRYYKKLIEGDQPDFGYNLAVVELWLDLLHTGVRKPPDLRDLLALAKSSESVSGSGWYQVMTFLEPWVEDQLANTDDVE